MPNGYYTVAEAAAKAGMSQEDLLRAVSAAGIKRFEQDGEPVFASSDIDKLASNAPRSSGDSIFQSSSSGLFDVDDLMAELGTSGGGKQSQAAQTNSNTSLGMVVTDEPTQFAAGSSKGQGSGGGAVMSDSGLFDVKELVQEVGQIKQNIVPDDSTVIESGKKKSGGGAVMSDSGLFDVKEIVGDTDYSPTAPVQVPQPSSPSASRSGGAVMSDSGLFNVAAVNERLAGDSVGPGTGDSGASASAPAAGEKFGSRSGSGSGAVMSDSGLFDVRELVGNPAGPKSSGESSANLEAAPTRLAATSSSEGVAAPAPAPAAGFTQPAKFKSSTGSGQSDSGLFSAAEVAKAVEEASVATAAASGSGPAVGAGGKPVGSMTSQTANFSSADVARAAGMSAPGSSKRSDSGLFSAAEVAKAAGPGAVDAPTKVTPPVRRSTDETTKVNLGAQPGAKGITIFDPADFNIGELANQSSGTQIIDELGGDTDLSSRSRAKGGSGAGLRSPAAQRDVSSLGGSLSGDSVIGDSLAGTPTGAMGGKGGSGMADKNALSSSAIFGAQRASSSNATEIMDAQPTPATVSGIFAPQGQRGRASATMQTEIMDAQPVADDLVADSAADSVAPGRPRMTSASITQSTTTAAPAAAYTPTPAYVEVAPPDHLEPFFGVFLFIALVLLVLAAIMGIYQQAAIKPVFLAGFVGDNAKFTLFGTLGVVFLTLIGGILFARGKN